VSDGFLTRWSHRKLGAAAATETKSSATSPQADSADAAGAATDTLSGNCAGLPGAAAEPAGPRFDPLSVPSLESITADTDIRGFLAAGVPSELARAALRRAWTADPKIRNFVGLADYDWDFNAPGAMAGFGPLEVTDELRRVAVQVISGMPVQDQTSGIDPASGQDMSEPAHGPPARPTGVTDDPGIAQKAPTVAPRISRQADDLGGGDRADGAAQPQQTCAPEISQLIVRRSHGGALPK
jgi:Protein of unknown function (DUF3306)